MNVSCSGSRASLILDLITYLNFHNVSHLVLTIWQLGFYLCKAYLVWCCVLSIIKRFHWISDCECIRGAFTMPGAKSTFTMNSIENGLPISVSISSVIFTYFAIMPFYHEETWTGLACLTSIWYQLWWPITSFLKYLPLIWKALSPKCVLQALFYRHLSIDSSNIDNFLVHILLFMIFETIALETM